MYYYYRLTSNNGFGDIYYCQAENIERAAEKCGLWPRSESGAIGCRISKKEYRAARNGYGVHIY